MRSSHRIRRFQANGGHSLSPTTPEPNTRQPQSPPHGLQCGNASQSIGVFARSRGTFISAPKATFRRRSEPKNAKTEKMKTRNEVNLTSEKYGGRAPGSEKTRKVFFPREPNLTPTKSQFPPPRVLEPRPVPCYTIGLCQRSPPPGIIITIIGRSVCGGSWLNSIL